MLRTDDELTNQITVISSYKSKSLPGREFYVTQEIKYSRDHQSLNCIPSSLSFWHMCPVFLWPWLCLSTWKMEILRVSASQGQLHSTQCLRRGGMWSPQFPPPSDRATRVHSSLYLHRDNIPGAQRIAILTHPFLEAILFHCPSISPGFHS